MNGIRIVDVRLSNVSRLERNGVCKAEGKDHCVNILQLQRYITPVTDVEATTKKLPNQ